MACRDVGIVADVGVCALPGVGGNAVRIRQVERPAAALPDGAHLAVRAADPRCRAGQWRDLPRRTTIARTRVRRTARVHGTRHQRLRRAALEPPRAPTLTTRGRTTPPGARL